MARLTTSSPAPSHHARPIWISLPRRNSLRMPSGPIGNCSGWRSARTRTRTCICPDSSGTIWGGGNQYDQQNAQYSLSHKRRRKCASHQSQSAVPAHTVPEDAHPLRIHLLEVVENGLGQLRGDVAVHFVSLIPGGFRRVDVEARAAAEIKGVVFALDFETT